MGRGDFLQGIVIGTMMKGKSRQDLTMTIHWEENLETESEENQYGRHMSKEVSPQNMLRGLAREPKGNQEAQ